MLRWLNRILILVFTFNILSPELLQARQVSRASLQQAVIARVDDQQTKPLSQANSPEELDQLYAARMNELANAYDTLEVTDDVATHNQLAIIIKKMHRTAEEYASLSARFKQAAQPQDPFIRPLQPAVADNTYRPVENPVREQQISRTVTVARFLDKVREDQLSVVDLIEEMDPLQAQQEMGQNEITAYAAEIILNTLNTLSADDAANIMDFLPRLQQRAMYRLARMPQGYTNSDNIIMARGTLRSLLYKIHQLYQQAGRKDPLAAQVKKHINTFIAETKAIKDDKKTKAGSRNFFLLKLQMEYTVRYALLANQPQALETLVDIFEQKPKHIGNGYYATKFQTDYSEILGTLFSTAAETLKFFQLEKNTANQALSWLVKMSGPQHATDTRVLAIGTAALLNHSTSVLSASAQAKLKGSPEQFYKFSPKQRQILANHAVDIYHPLNNSGIYGMQTYGLDSQQMQALANSLVSSIHGLLPITAPQTVWFQEKNSFGASTKIITLGEFYDQTALNKNGQTVRMPTFLFGSDGRAYPIYNKNIVNSRKAEEETIRFAARIVGEAVVWIFGGQIITFVCRALFMTARTVAFIPHAVRAAGRVQKGQRLGRFTAKMRQGWKYSASVNATLARSGAGVTATRVEEVVTKTSHAKGAPINAPKLPTAAKGVTKKAPTKILIKEPVTRSGTGYLGGRTGQAGTAGWFKRARQTLAGQAPQVETYSVFQHRPGFQFASAEIDATAMGLQNGIRTPLDKARFYRALQQQGINLTPFTYAERNLLTMEQQIIGAIGDKLGFDATASAFNAGTFDYWAYNGTKFERITPKDFFTRTEQLAAGAETAGGAEAVTDFYQILKVSPKASAAEIKGSYRALAKELHPDKWASLTEAQRAIAEEQFKQLGEAYRTLSNPTARAAYDARLANRPVTNMFAPKMPASPEGFQLAVSPKTGLFPGEAPAGFNPITQGGGMGINAQNVTGDLATQLAEHLVTTGQVPELAGQLIKNSPLYQMFAGNLKFFVGWDLLDRASYALQMPLLISAAEKQQRKELDRYGDLFAPQPGAQVDNTPRADDALTQVQTSSRGIAEHQGALLTLPIYGTMLATGKLNLVPEDLKALVSTQAKRLELMTSLAQAQNTFAQDVELLSYQLALTRQQYEEAARLNPDMAQEIEAVCQALATYEQEVQNAANADGIFTSKSNQLDLVIENHQQKSSELLNRVELKFLIKQLEEEKTFSQQMWNVSPQQQKEMNHMYDQTIAALQQAGQKPMDEMLALQEQIMARYNDYWQNFLTAQTQQTQQTKTWDKMNANEQKQALRQDWEYIQETLNAYREFFSTYGKKATDEFNQLVQNYTKQVEAVLNNSRLTPQEQAERYYPLVDRLEDEGNMLLNTYATQAAEEMDELLPSAY